MYEYLKGLLVEASPTKIVLDVGGVGYGIFISLSSFEKLPPLGNEVKIYIAFVVREDSHKFFGFLSKEEKELFHILGEISGIGPRLSLSILGHMSQDDLYLAVESRNTKALSQIPGIGKKTAERLLLELSGKFEREAKQKISFTTSTPDLSGDAIRALIHLGYPPLEAQKTVHSILNTREKNLPLAELISLALKAKKR